jgi:hypothetical protein
MAAAGVKTPAVIHASRVLSVAVDFADVAQVAGVLAHQVAALELLHSLIPQAAAAVGAATVQISAGIVTRDILVAMAVVDQLTHIIVQPTEQVAAVEQAFMVKVLTDLAAARTTVIQQAVAAAADQAELVDSQESHGQTVKVTAITVAETTVVVAVDPEHHTVADMVAVVQFELYGLVTPDHSQQLTLAHNYKYAC